MYLYIYIYEYMWLRPINVADRRATSEKVQFETLAGPLPDRLEKQGLFWIP